MHTITVELGSRRYPIYIGENLLANAGLITRHITAKQVLIVSNNTVADLYLSRLKAALTAFQTDTVLLPDGEQYKTLTTWAQIFDELLAKKHHRDTTLIALGGGVICDITGFAAACYQRGVNFIQIPTTLLAQVDASIGGKTAVNHPLGKNMIGAFHQPRCVLIDTVTLRTLPPREYNAGIAEIIKTALIRDASFFAWLEQNIALLMAKQAEILAEAIARSCAIKAAIVAEDEMETTGQRALLNLGHTFGHALEQLLGYGTWLHGEAVAAGTVLAADLSKQLGWLNEQDLQRIKQLFLAAQLPIQLPANLQCDKIIEAMALDKKVVNSKLRLVLLKAIGNAELVSEVDLSQVRQVITANSY